MSIRLRNILIFAFSFLFLVVAYWPALNGTPIWDDDIFWFQDLVMKSSEYTYGFIWQKYSWPLSVTLQKAQYSFFHSNYYGYHIFNLLIHFFNSLLVFKLGRSLKIKYNYLYFLLFLFHPAAVITTAWMIQMKTLLCFFFGLGALLTFLKGNTHIRWMIASWVLFTCSVISKSSSLFLPLIFLVISYRQYRWKKMIFLVPFFILSLYSGIRMLQSPYTRSGVIKAKEVFEVEKTEAKKKEKNPSPVRESKKSFQKHKKQKIPRLKIKQTLSVPAALGPGMVASTGLEEEEEEQKGLFSEVNLPFVSQALYYYFWQALVPLHNEPVKGPLLEKAGLVEVIHLLFLFMLIFLFYKDVALYYLAAAHLLLIPFLGFYPAPYMSVTWVSDQHLYLAMPALLAFWMRIVEKIPWKRSFLLPALFLLFFMFETFETTKYYKNQLVFYEKSLQYNPYNIPIAYNLMAAYIASGKWQQALELSNTMIDISEQETWMKQNRFYPHLLTLREKLKTVIEKHGF